jgi:hypothetical protein
MGKIRRKGISGYRKRPENVAVARGYSFMLDGGRNAAGEALQTA